MIANVQTYQKITKMKNLVPIVDLTSFASVDRFYCIAHISSATACEHKLRPSTVEFLQSLGLAVKDIGRLLTHCPNMLGYSIENRLHPSSCQVPASSSWNPERNPSKTSDSLPTCLVPQGRQSFQTCC
jgi:hypothetical protein